MIVATVALAALSLCHAAQAAGTTSLLQLYRDCSSDQDGVIIRLAQLADKGKLQSYITSAVSPSTLNAFKMLADLHNNKLKDPSDTDTYAVHEVASFFIPHFAKQFVKLAKRSDTIDWYKFDEKYSHERDISNIVCGSDNTVSADEYTMYRIADVMFQNVFTNLCHFRRENWEEFVELVPTLTSNWTFEEMAGSVVSVDFKHFLAFVFFVSMSNGAKTITASQWQAMGGNPNHFSDLAHGAQALSWEDWKFNMGVDRSN